MILINALIFISFFMVLVWLWYLKTQNPSVVDVAYGIGITMIGLLYLSHVSLNAFIMLWATLLLIWGLRLSFYLWYTRIRLRKIDPRYLSLSDNWTVPKPLGFLVNYQFQGLIMFLIALPFYFISHILKTPTLFDYCLMIAALGAMLGTTLADFELYNFKKRSKEPVCNQGLWAYSRHPNYFFEWLTWVIFAFEALQSKYGILGFISPLLLLYVMLKITGPLTEQNALQSKGQAFIDYQKKTPMFFPRLWKH